MCAALRLERSFVIRSRRIGQAIEDLFLLVMASQPGEWEGQVVYLPPLIEPKSTPARRL